MVQFAKKLQIFEALQNFFVEGFYSWPRCLKYSLFRTNILKGLKLASNLGHFRLYGKFTRKILQTLPSFLNPSKHLRHPHFLLTSRITISSSSSTTLPKTCFFFNLTPYKRWTFSQFITKTKLAFLPYILFTLTYHNICQSPSATIFWPLSHFLSFSYNNFSSPTPW